jgi:hypothetical protein
MWEPAGDEFPALVIIKFVEYAVASRPGRSRVRRFEDLFRSVFSITNVSIMWMAVAEHTED